MTEEAPAPPARDAVTRPRCRWSPRRGRGRPGRDQGEQTQDTGSSLRLEHHTQDTQGTDTDQPKMIESPTFNRTNDP